MKNNFNIENKLYLPYMQAQSLQRSDVLGQLEELRHENRKVMDYLQDV